MCYSLCAPCSHAQTRLGVNFPLSLLAVLDKLANLRLFVYLHTGEPLKEDFKGNIHTAVAADFFQMQLLHLFLLHT